MILIDTSAWIDFFRGKGHFADAVSTALEHDDAAICGPVLTELRRGLRTQRERRKVLPLLEGCHLLRQPSALWRDAGELGYVLARKGATVKTLDLIIAIFAMSHSVPILTADSDFKLMRRRGISVNLASP